MLRQAALLLLFFALAAEANRCKYRESRRPPALEIRRPRLCKGAGSFIGEDYWTSIGYDGQIRDGRSRADFLTFDQTTTGYIAYWITRTKYQNTHYEAFGHAFVRPDNRICAWFVGLNRETVEVCGGFRILSRNRYNPGEPIPFEWVQVNDYVSPKNTLGFHGHRIAKYVGDNEALYGDARLPDRNFQGVSPSTEYFVEVTSPADFERRVWLLRRKADVPEPSELRGDSSYIPDPRSEYVDPSLRIYDDVRGDPRLGDARYIEWLQRYDPRFRSATPEVWRYIMSGRPLERHSIGTGGAQPVQTAPAANTRSDGWQVVGQSGDSEGPSSEQVQSQGGAEVRTASGWRPVGQTNQDVSGVNYPRPVLISRPVDPYGNTAGQNVQPGSVSGHSQPGRSNFDTSIRQVEIDPQRKTEEDSGSAVDSQNPIGQGARPEEAEAGSGVDEYGRSLPVGSGVYPSGQQPVSDGGWNVVGQGAVPSRTQTFARVRPPTIIRDEFGTTYRQQVVDGHTYFYADPHVQGQQVKIAESPSDARLDSEQWRRQQEYMRRAEEERRAQEQRIRDFWAQERREQEQQGEEKKEKQREETKTKEEETQRKETLVGMKDGETKKIETEEEKGEEPVPFEKEETEQTEETNEKPERLPPPQQTAEETEEDEEEDV